eukprot:6207225-Pleurochrysis_carterae.AAC.1
MASRRTSQHRSGMPVTRGRSAAASVYATTAASWAGWLSTSASVFASRATDTASQCGVSARAPANSVRIWRARLVAVLRTPAAGSQSPTAITARGRRPIACAVAARAHRGGGHCLDVTDTGDIPRDGAM